MVSQNVSSNRALVTKDIHKHPELRAIAGPCLEATFQAGSLLIQCLQPGALQCALSVPHPGLSHTWVGLV